MKELSPLKSLKFFEQNLPSFMIKNTETKNLIKNLENILQHEKSANFHADVLMWGKKLIKNIIFQSIEFLSNEGNSPQSRSKESIDKYIDAFTLFEDLLFGLNPEYRDHTLHSLWIYLFGHQFITCIGGYETIKIAGQLNIEYSDEKKVRFITSAPPVTGSKAHLEAMWGMIAILHDLGYPVEAISNRPNEIFGRILDPFAIDFSSIFQTDLGSRITLLHQSVCDLLSTMYRPEQLTAEEKTDCYKQVNEMGSKIIVNFPREPTISKAEALEMEFRIASVDKVHSAWSAILSFKNIAYLHESDYHGGGGRDYLKLLTRRDVLYSIVHHTSEEPQDDALNRFQLILLLMDDIEEAIRFSRGGRERGIISDYCKVKWQVDKQKTKIEMDYTNYDYKAPSKYRELKNKYKSQISRKGKDYPYEVNIRFIDKGYNKILKLYFTNDN